MTVGPLLPVYLECPGAVKQQDLNVLCRLGHQIGGVVGLHLEAISVVVVTLEGRNQGQKHTGQPNRTVSQYTNVRL